MCCVVGYVGGDTSRERICEGLLRLEYRGYDSAGFACLTPSQDIIACKAVGGVQSLRTAIKRLPHPIDGHVGIGHTRWATNGSITELNAHPVFDCTQACAVVHNGIIDGEKELRRELLKHGHTFVSETDTELIAHLFEEELANAHFASMYIDLAAVIVAVIARLQGAYAFVVMLKQFPDMLVAVRRRSPLCVGFSDVGAYIASDPLAFAGNTISRVSFLPDESFALVQRDTCKLFAFNGAKLPLLTEPFAGVWEGVSTQGHPHYMLKEFFEQPAVLATIARVIPKELATLLASSNGGECTEATEYVLFGCGTSYHAAQIAQYYLQTVTHIPTRAIIASELRHQEFIFRGMPWGLCLSQSGETADALEAMRHLKLYGISTVGVVNRPTSTITREAHAALLLHAGSEISVGSTKTFTAHLAVLYLFAHAIAAHKTGKVIIRSLEHPVRSLSTASHQLQQGVENNIELIEQRVVPLYWVHAALWL